MMVMLFVLALHAVAFWQLLNRVSQPASIPVTAQTIRVRLFSPAPVAPVMPAPAIVAPQLVESVIKPPNAQTQVAKKTPILRERTKPPEKSIQKTVSAIKSVKPVIQKMDLPAPVLPQSSSSDKPAETHIPVSAPAPVLSQSLVKSPVKPTMVIETTPPRFDVAYLRNPKPKYPLLSNRLREKGVVFLKVKVNTAGYAEQILVDKSSGYDRLDQAAKETVQQWRFVPAREGEQVMSAWVIVPIEFTLKQ
ncbi:energy transducer TonB [Beggiatoa leptomitoformis]|nr:energy transducer TonB [Beggiatoa leptomitoformis]